MLILYLLICANLYTTVCKLTYFVCIRQKRDAGRFRERGARVTSPVGHSLAGMITYFVVRQNRAWTREKGLLLASITGANLPDLDFVVGFPLGLPSATRSIT